MTNLSYPTTSRPTRQDGDRKRYQAARQRLLAARGGMVLITGYRLGIDKEDKEAVEVEEDCIAYRGRYFGKCDFRAQLREGTFPDGLRVLIDGVAYEITGKGKELKELKQL